MGKENNNLQKNGETVTFAGGCFWCTEAVFKRLKGVTSVISGYTGGTVENPTYEQVCSGTTGHVEAIQVAFDPTVISYEKLLDVFWATHNPTTLNQQEYDYGTQYRSAIFYNSEDQKKVAEESKKQIEKEKIYKDRVVTEIVPFTRFYKAEEHHQDYYDNNKNSPYCKLIIDPKIQKLMLTFKEDIRDK